MDREFLSEEEAKKRFALLFGMRVSGLLMALLGLLLLRGGVIFEEAMPAVGAVVLVLGLVESFLAPQLARLLWKRGGR